MNPLNYYSFFRKELEKVALFPDRELRDIIYHLTGKDTPTFLLSPPSEIDMEMVIEETKKIIEKRKKKVPLDYILGKSFFMDIELKVSPSVLIPRPDTEVLVEEVLKHKPGDVVDIGTGSGNIGIVLARYGFKVTGTDISYASLQIAKSNAKLNKVEIETKLCPFFECFNKGIKFDYIVSNPPYISPKEYENLDLEVKQEPYEALVSPLDGLWHSLNILRQSKCYLKRGGYIFLEISSLRAEKYTQLAQEFGYTDIELLKDLNGNYRVLKARWI